MLAAGSEAAYRALAVYARTLGTNRTRLRFAMCLRKHRNALRSHTLCWGMTGFALLNMQRPRAAARWLADYSERDSVQPWMLNNLVLAFRELGRDAEANRAGRHALGLQEDYCKNEHMVWLALDDVLEGRAAEASARLRTIGDPKFDAICRYVQSLVRILLDLEQIGSGYPAGRATTRSVYSACGKLLSLNQKTVVSRTDPRWQSEPAGAVRRLSSLLGPWLGWTLRIPFAVVRPRV